MDFQPMSFNGSVQWMKNPALIPRMILSVDVITASANIENRKNALEVLLTSPGANRNAMTMQQISAKLIVNPTAANIKSVTAKLSEVVRDYKCYVFNSNSLSDIDKQIYFQTKQTWFLHLNILCEASGAFEIYIPVGAANRAPTLRLDMNGEIERILPIVVAPVAARAHAVPIVRPPPLVRPPPAPVAPRIHQAAVARPAPPIFNPPVQPAPPIPAQPAQPAAPIFGYPGFVNFAQPARMVAPPTPPIAPVAAADVAAVRAAVAVAARRPVYVDPIGNPRIIANLPASPRGFQPARALLPPAPLPAIIIAPVVPPPAPPAAPLVQGEARIEFCPVCDEDLIELVDLEHESHLRKCFHSLEDLPEFTECPFCDLDFNTDGWKLGEGKGGGGEADKERHIERCSSGGIVLEKEFPFVYSQQGREEEESCPICFEEFILEEDLTLLSCHCLFHNHCFMEFRSTKNSSFCPQHR